MSDPATPTLAPGQALGRCVLVRPLGAGGMGEVWEAELRGPQGFRKPIALKMLRADGVRDELRDALIREARLGALLHHPNVVGVHGLEEHDGRILVLMELVRGTTVAGLLRSEPLPPRCVLEVGIQACHGLAHVHHFQVDGRSAGLVHCDVKPQNLLVDLFGRVMVADLGVAAAVGRGEGRGTPGYAPPEQMQGRPVPASDLFALGVTLYACALRERPFGKGAGTAERVAAVEDRLADPGFLGPLDRRVPGLAAVLHRCLRADPGRRFASADELREALEALRPHAGPGPSLLELVAATRPDLPVAVRAAAPVSGGGSSAPTVVLRLGNLPLPPDRFVGRAAVLDALCAKVEAGDRLVTLLGPGGTGKTRLALRAAERLQPDLPGGAWFVDLTEATTGDQILQAIAVALGVPLGPGDPLGQIGASLRDRGRALAVFDNLEQCVGPARAVLSSLRATAPELTLLCTSRIALSIRDERRFHPGPLPIDEAVALFRDRAPVELPASADPDLATLVGALDGMPLAIELAAARAGVLPPAKLLERLGDGLRMLAGGGRDRPERHRSVEACLQWSWELLSAEARDGLAQLSVFDGGWTLEAAEAVIDLGDGPGWALDVLQELSDASMLQVDAQTGRFHLLVSVRAFAAARLTAEARDGAERRHADWFVQLGHRLKRTRVANAEVDVDNLLAAARRLRALGDPNRAVYAAVGALECLERRGLPSADARTFGTALLDEPLEELTRMWLCRSLGGSWWRRRDSEDALRHLSEGERLASRHDPVLQADCLRMAALVHLDDGRVPEARQLLERALVLAGDHLHLRAATATGLAFLLLNSGHVERAAELTDFAVAAFADHGDPVDGAAALLVHAALLHHRHDPQGARAALLRALELQRDHGDAPGEATTLTNLGVLDGEAGRLADAAGWFEAARGVLRRLGLRRGLGLVLENLGELRMLQGELTEARRVLREALAVDREEKDPYREGIALMQLGRVEHRLGDLEQAVLLLDQARVRLDEVGLPAARATVRAALAAVHLDAGAPELAEAALQRATALADASESVDARCLARAGWARLAHHQGDGALASRRLSDAEHVAPPERWDLRLELDAVRALLDGAGP